MAIFALLDRAWARSSPVERFICNEDAGGSTPLGSTRGRATHCEAGGERKRDSFAMSKAPFLISQKNEGVRGLEHPVDGQAGQIHFTDESRNINKFDTSNPRRV